MTAVVPAPFQTYFRLLDGQGIDTSLAFPQVATEDTITASTTQTQAGAYQLTAPLSRVTVSASAGNAVALPKANLGLEYTIINDGANAIQVYGNAAAADTINSIATATGISQPAGTKYTYTVTTAGNWITKSAGSSIVNETVTGTLTVSGLLALTGGSTGTFVANGATPVTVANTAITTGSIVLVGLNTIGGTVGAIPHVGSIAAGVNFTTVASASDTSTYNYAIITG